MTAVTTATENAVANIGLDDFGSAPVTSNDIMIPKIILMQKMSKKLDTNEDLKEGDLIDSLTDEKIGGLKNPLEIIPFHLEKVWFRSIRKGKDFELLTIEDVTVQNEQLRYTEIKNGEEYKNEMHMRFYCLRPDDMSLPYVIAFKGASHKKGKILATQMYIKNRASGMNQAGMATVITVTKETKGDNTFCVLNPTPSRRTTDEEQQECLKWFKTITASKQQILSKEFKSGSDDDLRATEQDASGDQDF